MAHPSHVGDDLIPHQPRIPEDGEPSHSEEDEENGERDLKYCKEEVAQNKVDKEWGRGYRIDLVLVGASVHRPPTGLESSGKSDESRIIWLP